MSASSSSHPSGLCQRCAGLDFESLVTAPWLYNEDDHHNQTALAAQEFEVERSVYINYIATYSSERFNGACQLCSLLAECARMTGDEKSLEDKHCAIRPKLTWKKKKGGPGSELVHTGQLYVWFHELKRNLKLPKKNPSGRRGDPRFPDNQPGATRIHQLRKALAQAISDGQWLRAETADLAIWELPPDDIWEEVQREDQNLWTVRRALSEAIRGRLWPKVDMLNHVIGALERGQEDPDTRQLLAEVAVNDSWSSEEVFSFIEAMGSRGVEDKGKAEDAGEDEEKERRTKKEQGVSKGKPKAREEEDGASRTDASQGESVVLNASKTEEPADIAAHVNAFGGVGMEKEQDVQTVETNTDSIGPSGAGSEGGWSGSTRLEKRPLMEEPILDTTQIAEPKVGTKGNLAVDVRERGTHRNRALDYGQSSTSTQDDEKNTDKATMCENSVEPETGHDSDEYLSSSDSEFSTTGSLFLATIKRHLSPVSPPKDPPLYAEDGDDQSPQIDMKRLPPNVQGRPPSAEDDQPSEPPSTLKYAESIIKSAIGSWRIDVLGEAFGGFRRPIETYIDLQLLQSWHNTCHYEHNHHTASSRASSRLKDLQERGLFKAIDTRSGILTTVDTNASFAALSYVWGTAPSHNAGDQSRGLESYASTIRDAAHLAEAVGIEWLWVDRICINQDDEDEKDALIPYIKDIFAGAELTIVAANGDGAHCGLAGAPLTPRSREKIFEFEFGRNLSDISIPPELLDCSKLPFKLAPATHSFNSLNNASTWHTRGWTFEEFVFSRRLLYIFSSEMMYSCSTHTFRESTGLHAVREAAGSTWGDSGTTPPSMASTLQAQFNGTFSREEPVSLPDYIKAIEEYTARELSVEEDRVDAFAGLVVGATLADKHGIAEKVLLKHGHPLPYFESLLTWQHVLEYDAKGPKEIQDVRLPKYGKQFAPSWSWASAGTRVHFLNRGQSRRECSWFEFETLRESHLLGLPSKVMLQHLATYMNLDHYKDPTAIHLWKVDGTATKELQDIDPRLMTQETLFYLRGVVKPWETPWEAPPTYSEDSADREGKEAHNSQSSIPSATPAVPQGMLPQLHLLTIVFGAWRYYLPDGSKRMALLPLHATGLDRDTDDGRLIDNWIMAPETPPRTPSNSSSSSPQGYPQVKPVVPIGFENKEVGLFCIIAGSTQMYLMALRVLKAEELPENYPNDGSGPLPVARIGLCGASHFVTEDGGWHALIGAGFASWRYICIF